MAEKIHQFSMDQISALASSAAGQELLRTLQQSGGAQFSQAAVKASAGDLAGARDLLAPLLADPEVQKLMRRLGGG